jgi:hypothetical protein
VPGEGCSSVRGVQQCKGVQRCEGGCKGGGKVGARRACSASRSSREPDALAVKLTSPAVQTTAQGKARTREQQNKACLGPTWHRPTMGMLV